MEGLLLIAGLFCFIIFSIKRNIPNEESIISKINIEGEKTNKFKELLLERISSKEKGPFIKDVLEKFMEEILS